MDAKGGQKRWWSKKPQPKKQHKKLLEGVMFVPLTPDGLLRKSFQEGEKNIPGMGRVKYVEKSGKVLKDHLISSDPWVSHCGWGNCFPCASV